MSRKNIFLMIRIFFTIFLLIVIFLKINFRGIIKIYKGLNPFYLVLSLFFYYLAFLILSIRWKILLLKYKKNFTLFEIFRVYLLGMLVNTISPATLGVDILRGYLISKKIEDGKKFAFASVLVDRLVGLMGIFSFAPISIFVLKTLPEPGKILFIFISFSLLILLFLYFSWSDLFENILKKAISPIKYFKLNEKIIGFYKSYKLYSSYPKELLFSYFLTLFLQSSFSIQAYFCALALNISISPFIFIFLIPLINALNFIPLTIYGIGLREAGFYILFSHYLSPEEAVSLSIIYFLTGIFANLPFIVYLFKTPLSEK